MQGSVAQAIEKARPKVLKAMSDRCYAIIMANFGIAGPERPWAWEPLSYAYAQKVGRTFATLEVSGALKASVVQGGFEGESTTVSMSDSSVPYATAHHFGSPSGNRKHPGLPARRVFPVDERGEVLDWTRSEVAEAARQALQEALS
jgi:phage gpG-like protein